MIKVYRCELCGHEQDVWRQKAASMPESVPCTNPIDRLDGSGCSGMAYPVQRIYPSGVVFKGGGWTPKPDNGDVYLDLGEDSDVV